MVVETLAVLAATAGTALVNAMVTDGWQGIRKRFARLLGRGNDQEVEAAAARLEKSRAMLSGFSGADLERAQAEQAVVWRTRLGDLLEDHPEVQGELRSLVAEVQAQVIGSAGSVRQQVTGFDQAQQAVQGHGVQHNVFGGQGERDTGQ
jgi:hypothetical protein